VFGFHNTDARMTVSETGQTGSRRRLPLTGVLRKGTRRPGKSWSRPARGGRVRSRRAGLDQLGPGGCDQKELVSASSGHGKRARLGVPGAGG